MIRRFDVDHIDSDWRECDSFNDVHRLAAFVTSRLRHGLQIGIKMRWWQVTIVKPERLDVADQWWRFPHVGVEAAKEGPVVAGRRSGGSCISVDTTAVQRRDSSTDSRMRFTERGRIGAAVR